MALKYRRNATGCLPRERATERAAEGNGGQKDRRITRATYETERRERAREREWERRGGKTVNAEVEAAARKSVKRPRVRGEQLWPTSAASSAM